jgi:ParB family chromosome partitioning protein
MKNPKAKKQDSGSGDIIAVPLNKLKKSPRNARKTPHAPEHVAALAASIAAKGMLQSPVVEPELDKGGEPTGFYLVTIGEGRRLAQALRAKRKEIAKDEPVRCVLDTAHNPYEISLAENAVRADMHPADQFEAFSRLHAEHGMPAEDIAARFGVTPAVVRQRLKLGSVSPKLIQVYRDGGMSLDDLGAFAVCDDHARQEQVWRDLPEYSRDRRSILHALNEGHVAATDRRARFVGAEAYEQAGGIIIRDLFDADGGGYFADADLLNRLARAKLEAEAAEIAKEGWKWVVAEPEADHGLTADMGRVWPEAVALTEAEQAKRDRLQQKYDALAEKARDGENLSEAEADKLDRLEQAIAAFERMVYRPEDIARAGVVVSLDWQGGVRIERGLVRPEDRAPEAGAPGRSSSKAKPEGAAALSDALVTELTAHRTAALRNELAQHPGVAFIATLHTLAAQTFYMGAHVSCLDLSVRSASLLSAAPGINETVASREIAARHEAWGQRLPRDPQDLWGFIDGLAEADRMALLAHCVALSVNTVRDAGHFDASNGGTVLAKAVGLDMARYWQPTVQNYLARVSKERIVEAVREGVSADAAQAIAGLKKQAMADAAAQRLEGTNWLPQPLRLAA